MALSGFFPKERINDFDPDEVPNLNVFMGHGKFDPVVPLKLGNARRFKRFKIRTNI